jgi:hypothetical protein
MTVLKLLPPPHSREAMQNNVIESLEKALVRARDGEFDAIVITGLTSTGDSWLEVSKSRAKRLMVLGALADAMHVLTNMGDED